MNIQNALDLILKSTKSEKGHQIRLAAPLGLGKPNFLLNAIYDRAKADSNIKLEIYTALSLTPPSVSEDLGRRFLEPFSERQWGQNYPVLRYYQDAARDQIPEHIRVHEFYFQSGSALKSKHLQRHYQSVNYTHVAENVHRQGINVVVQLIAARTTDGQVRYSLSCNPDLTLDLAELYKKSGKPLLMIGVVHKDLPFLEGESEVPAEFFTAIVNEGADTHELFALPHEPISFQDHMIGLQASGLVIDDGTIQVGIGSLSEAIGAALVLRQKDNPKYKALVETISESTPVNSGLNLATGTFQVGLYGLTEMVTDVFMHLRRAGILKREVIDEKSGARTHLHGAFYLGSKEFYQWLRDLSPTEMRGLRMTRVSKVNDLYDPNEVLLRAQRKNARFFNTCMQVSLLGEAVSETLSSGGVVSGIGGQYNFVAMAQELEGARSILMLRSTYQSGSEVRSNIVWTPGHVSIPRHLRDIIITEYGIADLRGKSDEECIRALLAITDSRFQDGLLSEAKQRGKISSSYAIPENFRNNTPERLEVFCANTKHREAFGPFPFGSDWTPVEERIVLALQKIKADSKQSKLRLLKKVLGGWSQDSKPFLPELQRMKLDSPRNLYEKFNQKLLVAYLISSRIIAL